MPNFKYQARDKNGRLIVDTIEAENRAIVAMILNGRGLIPVNIAQARSNDDIFKRFQHWYALNQLDLNDLKIFSRQMHSLSKAGVPIIRSIRTLIDSTRNIALVAALRDIARKLESGSSLSAALAIHPRLFNTLYINIIKVGENSGELDRAFAQIASYLEQEKETQSRIKSAIRYPIMVAVSITIAMIILNIYVIPAFKHVFASMHTELPWQTQLLINISNFTVDYWHIIILILFILFWLFRLYIKTPAGRKQFDYFWLKLPVVGSLVERAIMERFCRSFAMTFNSGVPIIQGINLVVNAIDNRYISSKLEQISTGIEKGDTISRTARNTRLFPPLVIQMIMIGEETGSIGDMLLEVADYYRGEVDADLKNLTSLIEPILILLVGLMVLVLALGIFLPIWNISTTIH